MMQLDQQTSIAAFLNKHRLRLATIPPLWIDGGAYKGEFIDSALDLRSDLVFEAFEPQPHRARKLRKKYRERPCVHIHEQSLGEYDSRVAFHITAANTLSSTLLPLAATDLNSREKLAVTQTIEVAQVCLESCLDTPPGLVKLDIQGMELAALKGMGKLLQGTSALLVERSGRRRYLGQASDEALHTFLVGAGFRLEDTLPHAAQDAPDVCDALYFRLDLP